MKIGVEDLHKKIFSDKRECRGFLFGRKWNYIYLRVLEFCDISKIEEPHFAVWFCSCLILCVCVSFLLSKSPCNEHVCRILMVQKLRPNLQFFWSVWNADHAAPAATAFCFLLLSHCKLVADNSLRSCSAVSRQLLCLFCAARLSGVSGWQLPHLTVFFVIDCVWTSVVRGPLRCGSQLRVKRGMITNRKQICPLRTNTVLNFVYRITL